jgi:hypothetical protein
MNKLWTFGCSFTSDYNFTPYKGAVNQMVNYKEWRNGNEPKLWATILADKLNLEEKNLGYPGSSVYKIFDSFCNNCHLIEKGDVVIFEWTRLQRFRVCQNGHFPTVLPAHDKDADTILSYDTTVQIQVNRDERPFIEEIYSFQNFIEEFCNSLGCEIYFWSADDDIINKETNEFKSKRKYLFPEANIDMTQYLRRKYGAETIYDETNGEVADQQHYGEKGHKVMGEIFYNEIIRYRNLQ